MPNTNTRRVADLPPPSVREAPGGVLDPGNIPIDGAHVLVTRSPADTEWREVFIFVGVRYENSLPVGTVIRDVEFRPLAQDIVANDQDIVIVRYEVLLADGSTLDSIPLPLQMAADFGSSALLDLSQEHYVAVADKAPVSVPAFARFTRTATWGTAPYRYVSSDDYVASVNAQTGEVTARGNGQCTITATDNQGVPRDYPLTVRGIRQLYYLSSSADWNGMVTVCTVASLDPVSLADIKRLWTLYEPSSGPVAQYLGWLNYPFWTVDRLGADTAWAYDLNGRSVNDNATAFNLTTHLPVLGASRNTP
ncbi:MAG: Ig-like domain-containing protein [Pseudomonas gingeri]